MFLLLLLNALQTSNKSKPEPVEGSRRTDKALVKAKVKQAVWFANWVANLLKYLNTLTRKYFTQFWRFIHYHGCAKEVKIKSGSNRASQAGKQVVELRET